MLPVPSGARGPYTREEERQETQATVGATAMRKTARRKRSG